MRELSALIKRYEDSMDWLNYRASLICAVISNAFRDSKKRRKAFTPSDFIPMIGEPPKAQTQTSEQMLATIKLLNAALGGRVVET